MTRQRARRYNRAVAIGVILSVAIHVLAVWLSPLVIRYLEPTIGLAPPPPLVRARPDVMRAVEVRVTETPEVEPRVVQPEPEPEEPEPAPVDREVEAGPVPSLAERLRPRVGDWRLWIALPPSDTRTDLTEEERAALLRERIYAALEAYDDSLAAALAAEAEKLDWTVGEEGNKWGLSPGKLHLGGITLPLPLLFAPHPATQRQLEGRTSEWEAIQRQAGQGVIDDTFEDRVKAIRERKEADEKAKSDTTGGGG